MGVTWKSSEKREENSEQPRPPSPRSAQSALHLVTPGPGLASGTLSLASWGGGRSGGSSVQGTEGGEVSVGCRPGRRGQGSGRRPPPRPDWKEATPPPATTHGWTTACGPTLRWFTATQRDVPWSPSFHK